MTARWTIYLITCNANGKKYVGMTKAKLRRRYVNHIALAMRGGGALLHSAIRKYGSDAFSISAVAEAVSELEARMVERGQIARLGSMAPCGYNLTSGGEKNVGFTLHEDVREKQRRGRLGKKHTAEARAKIAASRKGVKLSAETRAAQSAGKRGRPWTEKQRVALTAALNRPEVRAKLRAANAKRGPVVMSEKTREKLRQAAKNRFADPVAREKHKKGIEQARNKRSAEQWP